MQLLGATVEELQVEGRGQEENQSQLQDSCKVCATLIDRLTKDDTAKIIQEPLF